MISPRNPPETTRRSLSAPQQRLLAIMQRIRWGRIPVLQVVNGQPVVQGLRWVRTVKVLGKVGPHPSQASRDFSLLAVVQGFFRQLTELGDAEIRDLEIRDGLPLSYDLHESSPE